MNSISDDDNILGIWDLNSLINPISNQEQFYFSESNVNYMMDCFD